jgi:hypothetical protein
VTEATAPGLCGFHDGWADDTTPIGEDHGSGSAGTARICLPCARKRVESGGASKKLRDRIAAMDKRATQRI